MPNARGWKATRHPNPSWLHKTLTKSHTKTNSAVCHEAWLSTVWSVIISIKVSSISSLSECWKDPWAVYRVLKPDNRLTTFTFPTFLHRFHFFLFHTNYAWSCPFFVYLKIGYFFCIFIAPNKIYTCGFSVFWFWAPFCSVSECSILDLIFWEQVSDRSISFYASATHFSRHSFMIAL